MHIPASIRHGSPSYRPNREKERELTGSDPTQQFWPQHTGDDFLPNPSPNCTWNVHVPPSPLPPRAYPKSLHSSPRGTHAETDPMLSASQVVSQVDQSGVTSVGS